MKRQESLANAKVSARQPQYIGRNSLNRPHLDRPAITITLSTLHIVEKYFSVRNNSLTDNAGLASFV